MIKQFVAALVFMIATCMGGNIMAQDQSLPNARPDAKNVLGQTLESLPGAPAGTQAGFYRNGYCSTGPDDAGNHVVASTMTREFLDFTRSRGNDLQTPRPESNFPGLKPGDNWCLCAARWKEAEAAGVAPPVNLEATHESATGIVPLETLSKYRQSR